MLSMSPPPAPLFFVVVSHHLSKQLIWFLSVSGGDQEVHGPRGPGGRHQLPERLLPEDRHVRCGAGAVGARVTLQSC